MAFALELKRLVPAERDPEHPVAFLVQLARDAL
jgi:hypothetical protein